MGFHLMVFVHIDYFSKDWTWGLCDVGHGSRQFAQVPVPCLSQVRDVKAPFIRVDRN